MNLIRHFMNRLPALLACGVVGAAGAQSASPPAVPMGPPASAFRPAEPDRALTSVALPVPSLGTAPEAEVWETVSGDRSVRNVTRPTLTLVLPEPRKATGTAVIVAPGGAFMVLAFDIEGMRVARRLADAGIAAFVLKYRLDATPPDTAGFIAAIGRRVGSIKPGEPPVPSGAEALAEQDGLAAVRWVRENAARFNLRTDRIGFMGFSAGGMVTMRVATGYADAQSRPDFVAPIYGAMDLRRPVPADAPPMFVALAADDPLLAHMAMPMAGAWQKAKRPVELHLFETGGHGFGARGQGTSSDIWMDNFNHWLQARGMLAAPGSVAAAAAANAAR